MLDSLVTAASAAAHLPEDKVRCLAALVLTYPLSVPLQWHPSRRRRVDGSVTPAPQWATTLKHVYIVAVAAVLCVFCFPNRRDIAHLVGSALAVYAVVAAGVRLRLGKRFVAAAWAVALAHLSLSHIHRQITDWGAYKFDMTAPLMLMVIKLTGFAWTVYDYEVLRENPTAPALSPRQRQYATELPSLLEYFAYVFYFGGLLVGPAFEFADFRRFISGDVFLDAAAPLAPASPAVTAAPTTETPSAFALASESSAKLHHRVDSAIDQSSISAASSRAPTPPPPSSTSTASRTATVVGERVRVPMPSPALATLKCFATSALFMVGVVTLSERYAFARLLNTTYLHIPVSLAVILRRFLRLQVSGFSARLQYYAIWKLAEGSCVLAGLGFNGFDSDTGAAQWNRVTNVNIWALESAQSFKGIIDNWNLGTSSWLKHYVYLRLAPAGTRPTALTTVVTYATSAFWHGFYPGYYLTFTTGAMITETARVLRRTLRPHALAAPPAVRAAYNLAGWVLTQAVLNYAVVPFLLLSLADSLAVWRANYFAGHVGLVVAMVACRFVPRAAASAKPAGVVKEVPVSARSTSVTKRPATTVVSAAPSFLAGTTPPFQLDADAVRDHVVRNKSASPSRRRIARGAGGGSPTRAAPAF
ncbi:Lysophospholipid acyltransferase [Blastocladiella emersonii ATCC 22665]|nr:Lysophospholipid acyltransferase [Blastocladiella emersonii ATCC 22665]